MTEYLSVPSYSLVHGNELSYDELALVEPLAIGAHSISRANITGGEFVLVIGAGPIGLTTMEFVRIDGGKVIAMDINENRLQFCRDKLKVAYTINAMTENVAERLREITNGNMPTVVIDATGNLKAINNAFQYIAHGGRYVLIGLQKGDISFSHPEFHKREATLMSSRNATRQDYDHVIDCIKKEKIRPGAFITNRVVFDNAGKEFKNWLKPESNIIKVMVDSPEQA
jgi:threonine dehydrogenase-like Zn-dependent dehydrogenase